jgi:hypothetical protein
MENKEIHKRLKRRKFLKKTFNELADKITLLRLKQNNIEKGIKNLKF